MWLFSPTRNAHHILATISSRRTSRYCDGFVQPHESPDVDEMRGSYIRLFIYRVISWDVTYITSLSYTFIISSHALELTYGHIWNTILFQGIFLPKRWRHKTDIPIVQGYASACYRLQTSRNYVICTRKYVEIFEKYSTHSDKRSKSIYKNKWIYHSYWIIIAIKQGINTKFISCQFTLWSTTR